MVARSITCDPTRLKSLLDDELADRDQIELNEHLESCPECQQRLERLAAGTGFWGEIQGLGSRLGHCVTGSESVPETAWLGASSKAAETAWSRDQTLA